MLIDSIIPLLIPVQAAKFKEMKESKACQSFLHFSLILKYFTLHFIHFTELLSKINIVR